MTDDIEAVIREAAVKPYIGNYDPPPYEINMHVAIAAAAVRLLREPAELPAGWRACSWTDDNSSSILIYESGYYNAHASGGYVGTFDTLADAIAAVEAARSSGR